MKTEFRYIDFHTKKEIYMNVEKINNHIHFEISSKNFIFDFIIFKNEVEKFLNCILDKI